MRCNFTKVLVGGFVAVIVVALLMLETYRIAVGTEISHSAEVWGQFGDFFGGVLNPIISYLALFAAIAAVYYSQQTVEEARRQTLSSRSFELFRMWTSHDMHATRLSAWAFLNAEIERHGAAAGLAPLGNFTRPTSPQRNDFENVDRVFAFLANLNAIWDSGLIDTRLASRLMKEDIKDWFVLSESITFRAPGDVEATTEISDRATAERGRHLQHWYEVEILPLREKLKR